jgi:hypothetical protein
VLLIIMLVRKQPMRHRLSGAFGFASTQQEQQKPDSQLGLGTRSNPPHSMPPYGDEAVMMRTPDITQEQVPGALKVRGCYVTLL